MTTSAKHETRALLRAHLAAASGYRHFTRHCPVCHRLLRLAMEPSGADEAGEEADRERTPTAPPPTRRPPTEVAPYRNRQAQGNS